MMRLLALLSVLVLVGCATHQSPYTEGEKDVFVTTNEGEIFQAAYDAVLEGRKESPIVELDGPIRGYALTQKWGLDSWNSMIRVFPAKGTTAEGKIVFGYYPEVSGEGTLILRGPAMDKRIYGAALERFGQVGQRVRVTRIERANYRLERDRWRLQSTALLRDGGSITVEVPSQKGGMHGDVEERLKRAQSMRDRSLISEDEYVKVRAEILKGL
jgi:hypothetical protein